MRFSPCQDGLLGMFSSSQQYFWPVLDLININHQVIIKSIKGAAMYFPYYIPYHYIMPAFPIVYQEIPALQKPPIVLSSRDYSAQQKRSDDENLCEIVGTRNSNFINLTIEDLQEAGYEIKKKVWTEEQDRRLKELVRNHGTQWQIVQRFMPDRNSKMCYSRYKRIQYSPKNLWKKSENQLLQDLVLKFKGDWKIIAASFKNRNAKQIKQHYQNYLRPDIVNNEWSLAEDVKLINLLNKHGTQWKKIQQQMPERGQNQLKNRYFGRFRRIIEKKEQAKEKLQQRSFKKRTH